MKKCPLCGTMGSENDVVCGVCGTSFDQVKAESENDSSKPDPLTEAAISPARTRDERRKQRSVGLLFGIGMIVIGILVIQLIALVGFLMLLFGFTVMVTDISWMRGNTWYDQDEPVVHGRVPLRGFSVTLRTKTRRKTRIPKLNQAPALNEETKRKSS